jgi:hypothetical protein
MNARDLRSAPLLKVCLHRSPRRLYFFRSARSLWWCFGGVERSVAPRRRVGVLRKRSDRPLVLNLSGVGFSGSVGISELFMFQQRFIAGIRPAAAPALRPPVPHAGMKS